jgi:hypothetical protein
MIATEPEKTAAALRLLEAYRAWIEIVDDRHPVDVRLIGLGAGSILLTESAEFAGRIREILGVVAPRLEVDR